MADNENVVAMLDKYLANSPENIHIPPDADQEILSEFVDSTMSSLEKLEGTILAFESGQIMQDDFVTTARRILHNIKGEAGIMDFPEISNLCHHAESLLFGNSRTIPVDTLFSVKDWLARTMQYLAKTNAKLSEHIFRTQTAKILDSAEIDLFDLGHGTSDAQAVQALSSKMAKITELAAQIGNVEVKTLANKTTHLLQSIGNNEQCIISDAHKESLFGLLDDIRKRVLDYNNVREDPLMRKID